MSMSPTSLARKGDARCVGEVGRDEVGPATLQLDLFDRLHTARRVPAMHGDVGAIARELRCDRAPTRKWLL